MGVAALARDPDVHAMSKLQELPPDNRAVLSLLLRQQRSYADIADMLTISEQAVHDRAHAALILLSPRLARELDGRRREEVGEYLLGQQAPAAAATTREHLLGDPTALAWARSLHAELADLAGEALPVLPAPPAASAGAPAPAGGDGQGAPRRAPELPVSRRGGAILLGVIFAAVIVIVILIVSGGKGGPSGSGAGNGTASTGSHTAGSGKNSSTSKTGSSGSQPRVDSQINLSAAEQGSKAVAVAFVLSERSTHIFYMKAEHLPKTEGFFYVVWLERSDGTATALGKAPEVGSNERLSAAGQLPSNAGDYSEMILTRETDEHATHPGQVVLRGKFTLH
jgi:Sigma-70, region 4